MSKVHSNANLYSACVIVRMLELIYTNSRAV